MEYKINDTEDIKKYLERIPEIKNQKEKRKLIKEITKSLENLLKDIEPISSNNFYQQRQS